MARAVGERPVESGAVVLKPRADAILKIARDETTVDRWQRFEPICRGPVFAVAALAAIGLVAVPWVLYRAVTSMQPGLWTRHRRSM